MYNLFPIDTFMESYYIYGRHTRAVMHVGNANPWWWGKCSRHSRRMRNPQFYVSGKRPMKWKCYRLYPLWKKGHWCTTLMFLWTLSFCTSCWTNSWVAGDLWRSCDVNVMLILCTKFVQFLYCTQYTRIPVFCLQYNEPCGPFSWTRLTKDRTWMSNSVKWM